MSSRQNYIDSLGDNDILFLVGALNREFGGQKNWPTRTANLDLPAYIELMVNLQILKRLNANTDEEPVDKTGDEYIDHFVPSNAEKNPKTNTTRKVRSQRNQKLRNFQKKKQKLSN